MYLRAFGLKTNFRTLPWALIVTQNYNSQIHDWTHYSPRNLNSHARTGGPHKYRNTGACSHTLKRVKLNQAASVTAGTNTCPTTPKCMTALLNALMHGHWLCGYNPPLHFDMHTHTYTQDCMDSFLHFLWLFVFSCPAPEHTNHQSRNQPALQYSPQA